MVAGFGEGYASAIWTELARITTEEERTRYFALLKVCFFLGVVLGPALNLFLKECDFYIGNWHIDFRTSPGFFMALMWILATGIMFVFVYDLSDEMRKKKGYEPVSDGPSEEQFSEKEQLQEAYSMEIPKDKHGDMTASPFINDDDVKTEEIAKDDKGVFPDDSTKSRSASFRDALIDMFAKFHVIVTIALDGIASTVINAIGRSLVSKHTNPGNQGKVQAIMTVLNRLALLIGPLIGSSLFTYQKIFAIILSGSQIFELVLVIIAFNKLKVNLSKC
ncbi:major facilitator superfamily domain-containing 8-like [Paramuricea clavata]|uniref:Major facilitator superfamily domain-containing 8-like n=1 Tax=Paramuricea clavata TaxID=317549 RepID=A0A7D9EDB9_PARCT|nr:major facilitator superfamily domain-containing 8-like [Paramuricea clavata]